MDKKDDTTPRECPVVTAINIVGGKWKLLIIALLRLHTHRFGEIKRALPQISERMLARQLRELERDRLISRKVYPEVPPHVEYTLTKNGKSLIPILDLLAEWGKRYRELHNENASREQGLAKKQVEMNRHAGPWRLKEGPINR